jgi:LmbE family N-acetylglucosaminyl deacetylase
MSEVVLVVAPHPDDETLGCGGSIANHTASGRTVHLAFLTSGESGGSDHPQGGLGRRREGEAVAAASVLGVLDRNLRFMRFPDGGIDPTSLSHVGAVVSALRELRPALLYVPHRDDGSFDHQAAFALCWRAAGMAGSKNFPKWGTTPHWVPTILGYEVWSPIAEPAYTEDITAMVDRKIAALGCYSSQAGGKQTTHVGPAGVSLSAYRGATRTGGHREAFAVLRVGSVV